MTIHDHTDPADRAAALCRLLRLPGPSGLAVVGAGTVAAVHHHPAPPARPPPRPVRDRGRAAGAGAVRQGRRIPAARRDPLPRPHPPRRPTHRHRPLPAAGRRRRLARRWPISSGRPPARSSYAAPPIDGNDQPRRLRFGAQLDARPVTGAADRDTHGAQLHPETVAAYIAKYATKAAADLPTDHNGGNGHLRRLQATLRQLAGRAAFAALTGGEEPYRGWGRWVDMLGFRGHLATKSRRYSTTLGRLRQARRDYARRTRPHPPRDSDRLGRPRPDDLDETTLVIGVAGGSPAWAGSPPAMPPSPPPPLPAPAMTDPARHISASPDDQPIPWSEELAVKGERSESRSDAEGALDGRDGDQTITSRVRPRPRRAQEGQAYGRC